MVLLCLFSLLIGCSKDDFEAIQNSSRSITTTKTISLEEFGQRTAPFEKYRQTQNNIARAKTSKLLYNARYSFTIDTDKIVYMEKDGKHSYTFPIYRDTDNGKVENYIINENDLGEFEEFIAKYNLTEQEKEKIENHEPVALGDKTEVQRLGISGLSECDPVVINIEKTYDGNGTENGSLVTYMVPIGCKGGGTLSYGQVYNVLDNNGDAGGGQSGGNGSGSNGYGGDGGTPSGNPWSSGGLPGDNSGPSTPNNPNAPSTGGTTTGGGTTGGTTTPTIPGGSTGDQTITSSSGHHEYHDPTLLTYVVVPKSIAIVKLEEITNDNSKPYKAKVAILQQSLNEPLEKGFEFRTNDNGGLEPATFIQGGPKGVQFPLPEINTIVRMHSHPNHIDPVFSAQDISGMAEFFAVKNDFEASDDEDIISLLITSTGAFALKIDDINKVWSFNQDMKFGTDSDGNSKKDKFEKSYKRDIITKARNLCNNTCTDAQYISYLEANLLVWLSNQNTGLGLYKGTLKPDGTYNWIKTN